MTEFDSYCGLSCKTCEFRESMNCKGCIASEGHPFHGECKVAECAKERKVRFCGECQDMGCELLKSYSYDKEHGDDGKRIENCQKIKTALVKEAREGIDPIAVCGFHCDECFFGQWCGGCRSDYDCCSFATLFEDKKCPNVTCSKEKTLDGCYECNELDHCKIGFYGNANEYTANATAQFIKKHGPDCYTKTLRKSIEAGVKYPQDFDATGSVESALAMLEQYI